MNKSIALIGSCLLAASAYAQVVNPTGKSGGYGPGSPYNDLYNPATSTNFRGKVSGIAVSPPHQGMAKLVTIFVKPMSVKTSSSGKKSYTYGKPVTVDLGPQWFVDNQVAKVKMNALIQVFGSKVQIDGRPEILAEMVRYKKNVLSLRRSTGVPYWMAYQNKPDFDPNVVTQDALQGSNTGLQRFQGQVVSLQNVPVAGNVSIQEATMTVQTANGPVTVDLGPDWYYNHQDQPVQVGSNIYVYGGDPVVFNSSPYIAYGIMNGTNYMGFRDTGGRPLWIH